MSIASAVAEQRPTVLLFDWDNTLVDGWVGITSALNAAFAAFDKPLWTKEDTKNRVRVALKESFPVMFGDTWERARDIFYQAFQGNHLDVVTPMPGAAKRCSPQARSGREALFRTKPGNIFARRLFT